MKSFLFGRKEKCQSSENDEPHQIYVNSRLSVSLTDNQVPPENYLRKLSQKPFVGAPNARNVTFRTS